jgi:site-specific recombinase XerD
MVGHPPRSYWIKSVMPSASSTTPIPPSRPTSAGKRYIHFHGVCHPSEMGAPEVEAFLTHLAVKENVAASTQNQALNVLLILYRQVLHQDLGPIDALRAKHPKRLPTVLTKDETLRLIGCLSGTQQLMAKLIYGSGIRLMECLRLRAKDLEFERRAIMVRGAEGAMADEGVSGGSSPETL